MYEKYAKKASKGQDKVALMVQNTGSRSNRNSSIARGQSINSIDISGSAASQPLEKKKSLKKIATGVMKANSKLYQQCYSYYSCSSSFELKHFHWSRSITFSLGESIG